MEELRDDNRFIDTHLEDSSQFETLDKLENNDEDGAALTKSFLNADSKIAIVPRRNEAYNNQVRNFIFIFIK